MCLASVLFKLLAVCCPLHASIQTVGNVEYAQVSLRALPDVQWWDFLQAPCEWRVLHGAGSFAVVAAQRVAATGGGKYDAISIEDVYAGRWPGTQPRSLAQLKDTGASMHKWK